MAAWKAADVAGTNLDPVSERMLVSSDGHVVLCDDPQLRERLRVFLNARPLAYVVGDPRTLETVTPEYLETASDLEWVDSLRKVSLDGGKSVYGMYLAPLR